MRRHARSLCRVLDEQVGRDEVLRGVEVGVWKGELSRDLLSVFPELYLSMVDVWESTNLNLSMHEKDREGTAMSDAMQTAIGNVAAFSGRFGIVREESVNAAGFYPAERFDFVFVDADHFYENVKSDVEAWWPKVRRGGVLGGHDYDGQGDRRKGWGVKRAVDEFCEERRLEVNVEPGLIWWVKK